MDVVAIWLTKFIVNLQIGSYVHIPTLNQIHYVKAFLYYIVCVDIIFEPQEKRKR